MDNFRKNYEKICAKAFGKGKRLHNILIFKEKSVIMYVVVLCDTNDKI